MRVKLLYFAILRDLIGSAEEEKEIAAGTTAGQLWSELRAAHPGLQPFRMPPMIAVNERYAAPETQLTAGDVVAFIPPVSGG